MSHPIKMDSLARQLADWEIRYQFNSPHAELFIAENCTASQAWYRFLSLIPEDKRGAAIAIGLLNP